MPSNGKTDSSQFDTILIFAVIRSITNAPPPINGWGLPLEDSDQSVGAFVSRARNSRNLILHAGMGNIYGRFFKRTFDNMRTTLLGLEYTSIEAFDNLLAVKIN